MRTHSSWRDLPLEFGKWETAYKRYRLSCNNIQCHTQHFGRSSK
jgi:transposase